MKTIRIKLILIFSGFMIAFVICGILFNMVFLEKYYIYKNKSIFTEASKNIANEYTNNRNNVLNYIDIIDRVEGISCTIADNNLEIKFNSYPQKAGVESQKLPNEIETLIKSNEASLSKGFIYSIVEKPQEQAAILVYISKIDNGNLIVLKKSMKGIIDSVAIANQFYIFAGLILIFLGAIFIFIFAGRITKPIREMSAIAEDISKSRK